MQLPDILDYLLESYRQAERQAKNLPPDSEVVLPPAILEFANASRLRMQQNQMVAMNYDEAGVALRLQDNTLLRYVRLPEDQAATTEADSPAIPIMRSAGTGPGIGSMEGRSWPVR